MLLNNRNQTKPNQTNLFEDRVMDKEFIRLIIVKVGIYILHLQARYVLHYCPQLGLCCLMTAVLSKDIWCHVWPQLFCSHVTRAGIRPQVKWTINLAIADAPLIFHRVCVGMYGLIYLLTSSLSPIQCLMTVYSEWCIKQIVARDELYCTCDHCIKYIYHTFLISMRN